MMRLTLVLALLSFIGVGTAPAASSVDDLSGATWSGHGFSALVFSKTSGFRHDSIDEGIAAITALGAAHDFSVQSTEDASIFTDAGLAPFQVIIFLSTTGDVLDAAQQAALERFIAAGGGWVGIHAAADTEYSWSWYGGLVGAWFQAHPATQAATVRILDRDHPSTSGLQAEWTRTDEWYDYQTNPRGQVHVLATLDDDSYSGGGMGFDHPIAWCRPYSGGRSWYTGMGHTPESFGEADFQTHLLGGIEWAAGAVEGDCTATIGSNYDLEVLEPNVDSPMDLAVAPDGSVFFVELSGNVRRYDPVTRFTTTVAEIDVFQNFEDGLIGIVLDPDFESNGWMYLFYSPAGGAPRQHVSRFEWNGTTLDVGSEKVLLSFPTQRQECCHSGGAMVFDATGNLFIATGDNTNPFASDGFAPIDERSGRGPWDAQKSSGNTADLRGKILRITPQPDGSYLIPEGNLFPDAQGGSPEIYVMGVRNPFRISVDPQRGWLYWGDVGPDGRNASSARGPAGLDEWNQAREAGNFGWPYCIGPNIPYNDFSFTTGTSSGLFDCAAPTNNSPNNTGAVNLPPAQEAWIWYPYGASTEFPGISEGNGRTAMAGPVYQYDSGRVGEDGLPAYFHDRLIVYEWSRSFIRIVTLDDDGQPLSIDPFPGNPSLAQPIAMKAGPDGSLYILEWGSGFGTGNPDAQLSRIVSTAGGKRPQAVLTTDVVAGPLPLTVNFSAVGSSDPDGDLLQYAWDVDADGITDATSETYSHTYNTAGAFTPRLVVSDPFGNDALASVTIYAGNSAPTVAVSAPGPGGFFAWGDEVSFSVSVSDAEDGSSGGGTIDCARVQVQAFLGHDSHTHPLETTSGCEGTIQLSEGHGGDGDQIFQVVEFSYTDLGAEGVPGITTTTEVVLLPNKLEAEHFDDHQGVQIEATSDILGGGSNIGFIDHGDWVRFDEVSLAGVEFLTFRTASAGRGGRIEVRRDLTAGEPLATIRVQPTGGWQVWRDLTVPVDAPEGGGPLYLLFLDQQGGSGLFNINYIKAHGPGVSTRQPMIQGWTANYSQAGTVLQTRIEPQISFDWGSGSPLPNGGTFRGDWASQVLVPAAGNYEFTLRAQGSATLTINGVDIISIDSPNAISEKQSGLVRMRTSSAADVSVRYESVAGAAAVWLEIAGGGLTRQSLGEAVATPVGVVSSEVDADIPHAFSVSEAYPNPATGAAKVNVSLPAVAAVTSEMYDLLGRRVAVLPKEELVAGVHEVTVLTNRLAPGLYFLVVQAGPSRFTRSVVVIR